PDAPEHLKSIRKRTPISRNSINVDDLGLVILRSHSKKPETMLTIKYGGIYGGHDHADKLDITLFAESREMLSDLGYVYSSHQNIFTWMQRSIAHNTVTVDGINQRYMHGACELFHSKPGFQVAETRNPWIYHTITDVFNRQIIHVERENRDYVIDIFRVSGGTMHDWSVHAETSDLQLEGVHLNKMTGINGRDYAYEHLKNVRTAKFSNGFKALWNWWEEPLASLKLHLISPDEAQIFLANAPAQRKIGQEGRILPYIIIRTEEKNNTTFIAVWEPFSVTPALESVQLNMLKETSKKSWPIVIQIKWKDGVEDFITSDLTDQPDEKIKIYGQEINLNGRIGLIRFQNDEMKQKEWVTAFLEN
ncbi:MAG: heparinase II/III family protein, partial [bacterium]